MSARLPRSLAAIVFDVVALLSISLIVSAGHFSVQQGRAIICADSLQYFDNAEAIVDADRSPEFGFRKPGYSYLLSALLVLFGHETWPAVVFNHICLSLLPLAAYGLACNLHSRTIGWLAGILMIARLHDTPWGERIMSEPVFSLLLSFGVLAAVLALTRASRVFLATAGVLLGLAWFCRSVAIIPIAVATFAACFTFRRSLSQLIIGLGCLATPLLLAGTAECWLNHRATGNFRTCTNTLGAMVLMRARHIQNFSFSESESASEVVALLPERSAADAYRVNHVDTWVARHHALQNGMNDWQLDALFAEAGWEMIKSHPSAYARTTFEMFVRTLLRGDSPPNHSRVSDDELAPILVHPAAKDESRFQDEWFDYWALPNRATEDSVSSALEPRELARQRAPFGRGGWWDTIRYWTHAPIVTDLMKVLRSLAMLWPGIALLFFRTLQLNRRTCAFIAATYVLDACLIGLFGASDQANERYQWVWVATDTTLAAALFAPLVRRHD